MGHLFWGTNKDTGGAQSAQITSKHGFNIDPRKNSMVSMTRQSLHRHWTQDDKYISLFVLHDRLSLNAGHFTTLP